MGEETFHGEKPQTCDLSQYLGAMSDWVARRLGGDAPARMVSLEPTPVSANGFAGESFILEIERDDAPAASRIAILALRPVTNEQASITPPVRHDSRLRTDPTPIITYPIDLIAAN